MIATFGSIARTVMLSPPPLLFFNDLKVAFYIIFYPQKGRGYFKPSLLFLILSLHTPGVVCL